MTYNFTKWLKTWKSLWSLGARKVVSLLDFLNWENIKIQLLSINAIITDFICVKKTRKTLMFNHWCLYLCLRGGKNVLVMCETYKFNKEPTETNHRKVYTTISAIVYFLATNFWLRNKEIIMKWVNFFSFNMQISTYTGCSLSYV